ncbi:MAG: META domain-containing protein [Chloroflexota bacterium]
MKRNLLILLFIGVVLSSCSPQPASLIGAWKLTGYGPEDSLTPAVTDAEAVLAFGKDGTVTGSAGCNSLGGDYEVDGGQLIFGPITSTLMGCDDARMVQESALMQVLTGTAEFEIEDNTLTLKNKDMLLVFTSATAYP